MTDKIQCETHGETEKAFVCKHLGGETFGQGFNREEPSEANPFPDAWCDDCETIRAAHDGWTEETGKLAEIRLVCSGCYEWTRIRNTHTTFTLDELNDFHWKCGNCEEWHSGACLDFTYDSPYYWDKEFGEAITHDQLFDAPLDQRPATFLNLDCCAIENQDFFVRGNIHLPIIGTSETFRWGVWGSISRENFETLLSLFEDPKRVELPPMFSWMSSQIKGYPETLSLKMFAHIQEPGWPPHFELEETDHPLSQEYYHGITAERVKEIMMSRLPGDW